MNPSSPLNRLANFLNKNSHTLFTIFLIFIPLVPSHKSLNNLFYILILAPSIILLKKDDFSLKQNKLLISVLTFSVYSGLSILWSSPTELKEVKYIFYVLLFIIGSSKIINKLEFEKLGIFILISLTIQLGLSKNFATRLSGHGVLENALYASQYYLFYFWLFLTNHKWHKNKISSKLIQFLGVILSFSGILLCKSRASFFCLFVILSIYVIQRFKVYRSLKATCLIVISIVLSIAFINHKNWITFPKKDFSYTFSLKENDRLTIIDKKDVFVNTPVVEGTKSESFDQNIKGIYTYIAPRNDDYEIVVNLKDRTAIPWSNLDFTLNEKELKHLPPRILQFELSFGRRATIWKEGIKEISKEPFFGHGISTDKKVYANGRQYNDFHNFYIGTAYKTGLVGLALYLLVLAYSFLILLKEKDLTFLLLLICGMIMTSFDDESIFNNMHAYWLLLLLPISKAFFYNGNKAV